jgi:hypothetical protein
MWRIAMARGQREHPLVLQVLDRHEAPAEVTE